MTKLNKRLKRGENISIIKHNNENICSLMKNVYRLYPVRMEMIIYYLKNLSKISIKMVNEYFKTKILNLENKNGSVPASLIIEEGEIHPIISIPYLQYNTEMKFTLVLDLDETLIHFKMVCIYIIT